MRILHVNVGYPPFIGGAQVLLHQVARLSAQRGHQVAVYTSDAGEVDHLWSRGKRHLSAGHEEKEGVSIYRFPVRHLPLLPYSYHALRRLAVEMSRCTWISEGTLSRLARLTPWLPDLEKAFETGERICDLVHAWNIPYESLLIPAWRYVRRHRLPFIFTPLVHLGEKGSESVRRFYAMRHQLAMLRDSDAVIALTPLEADFLVGQGVAADRVHIIGGGVEMAGLQEGDAARFRRRWGLARPFILYVGVLNYQKGVTHLVQAMAALWQRGYEADLVMIGQPMAHFQAFYRRLSEEQRARCHLLGLVTEQEKADALAACQALALPSRTESFGLVFLEAWALGKPVIGARAGAVPAVVDDGTDGLLVPFGDVKALAESLAYLLDHPDLAEALGRAGQRKVQERFTWERAAAQLEEVYQMVAGAYDAGKLTTEGGME